MVKKTFIVLAIVSCIGVIKSADKYSSSDYNDNNTTKFLTRNNNRKNYLFANKEKEEVSKKNTSKKIQKKGILRGFFNKSNAKEKKERAKPEPKKRIKIVGKKQTTKSSKTKSQRQLNQENKEGKIKSFFTNLFNKDKDQPTQTNNPKNKTLAKKTTKNEKNLSKNSNDKQFAKVAIGGADIYKNSFLRMAKTDKKIPSGTIVEFLKDYSKYSSIKTKNGEKAFVPKDSIVVIKKSHKIKTGKNAVVTFNGKPIFKNNKYVYNKYDLQMPLKNYKMSKSYLVDYNNVIDMPVSKNTEPSSNKDNHSEPQEETSGNVLFSN